jgi:hypothetical protein
MDLLERQFLNGRDSLESRILLTAHWIDGWKFKDGKWKYEEEERLSHVDEGWFRCRVHLYTSAGTSITKDLILENLQTISSTFEEGGVSVQFSGKHLMITVPLKSGWGETENESMNPKIFRYFESLQLPLRVQAFCDLQILITYRNLDKLYGPKRMFIDEGGSKGYRWVGLVRSHP